MKTTVNYGLKKPDGTDVVNIDDFNYNSDAIDQKLKEIETKASNITVPVTSVNGKTGAVILSASDIKAVDGKTLEAYKTEVTSELAQTTTILTATGTANAITLNITLQDKKKYSFKAIANSTGAVTINGKPFKKVDGTAISNVKGNKVYDFYYDATANSVFILAKAEGDALVGHVLAGKTFSNGDDTGLVGTMPNRTFTANGGNYTPAKSALGDGTGSLCIEPQTGYYQEGVNGASFGSIICSNANFKPENIKKGVTVFGVTGTSLKYGIGDFMPPSAVGLGLSYVRLWNKEHSVHCIDDHTLRNVDGTFIGKYEFGNGLAYVCALGNGGMTWYNQVTATGSTSGYTDIKIGCVKNGAYYYLCLSDSMDLHKVTPNGTITRAGQNTPAGNAILSSSDAYIYTMGVSNDSTNTFIQIRKHDSNTLATISNVTCTISGVYRQQYYNSSPNNTVLADGPDISGCVDSNGNIYICYNRQWKNYGRDDDPDYYGVYDHRMWKFASTGGSPIATLVIGSNNVGSPGAQLQGSGKMIIDNNTIYQVDTRGVLRSINTSLVVTSSYSGVQACCCPKVMLDGKIQVWDKVFTRDCLLFNTVGIPNDTGISAYTADILCKDLTSAFVVNYYSSYSYYQTFAYNVTTGYIIKS